jgi:methylenetetrahydrofolate dehydrogenase (NADP+)/methenyltetrahydrofolate cyclohydrolase
VSIVPLTAESRSILLDGKAVGEAVRGEVARGVGAFVARTGRRPGLAAVLVGDDPASQVYVANKTQGCQDVGMVGRTERLPSDVLQDHLLELVDRLNADPGVDGILVQVPLPKGLSTATVQSRVDPRKDVDGLHPLNVGRLWLGQPGLRPATPVGVIDLLDRYQFPFAGAHAVVVGRSDIVGKPMAALLLQRHCTVTLCHSRTRDLAAVCRRAELLIVAVGIPAVLGADAVGDGAVVIDVGTNRVTDRALVERLFPDHPTKLAALERRGSVLVGDVDTTAALVRARAITPVPGGVGPLTIANVLRNTLEAACGREGLRFDELL